MLLFKQQTLKRQRGLSFGEIAFSTISLFIYFVLQLIWMGNIMHFPKDLNK